MKRRKRQKRQKQSIHLSNELHVVGLGLDSLSFSPVQFSPEGDIIISSEAGAVTSPSDHSAVPLPHLCRIQSFKSSCSGGSTSKAGNQVTSLILVKIVPTTVAEGARLNA
ncbi:hypothetical protein R6Q57_015901 [Mikania cordata]